MVLQTISNFKIFAGITANLGITNRNLHVNSLLFVDVITNETFVEDGVVARDPFLGLLIYLFIRCLVL